MLEFYQSLPQKIDPVFFQIGSFSVYWYSIMYLVGFLTVVALTYYRFFKKETSFIWGEIFDFIFYGFWGGVIGGRIGYVIFYNLDYFWNNPLQVFWPFSDEGGFTGIYGMSFHGGVLGFVLTAYFFTRKRKIVFWKITEFVLPAVPAGYFFGRIGNFINGELYGRATSQKWGMDFGDSVLRHPSQLYEAFFEGIVLFLILWSGRNKFKKKAGLISGVYVLGYGIARFVLEFWRQPDEHLGFMLGFLTMGQILSIFMIVAGTYLIFKNNK
ncbi:MAG: prolipoprotein diacylglyceryl transferase [Candidatus Moranbacteria bacterium]|jgi:phosphatidylglycerol:prolipoprotein diacylglycerol transferase|nr:prolipoprotein diacylglyceryl transferase [Candidatus Moranbacteria bacterium]